MRRAVFLDRDGVLNRAEVRGGRPYPPATLADFEILPDVPAALESLKAAKFLLIVATNQPDVATGVQSREAVEAMHQRLLDTLPIDDIRVCFEVDGPNCRCYKPKPGMLFDAAEEHNILLSESFMIGDRWRDVGAGAAAGCSTIFIDYGYSEALTRAPDFIVGSTAEAASVILDREGIAQCGHPR